MNKLGELLTVLRKKNNLSQKNMADILQVSTSAVSKWENNQNYPDLILIPQIAELFHITCDELLHPKETLEKLQEDTFAVELTPVSEDYSLFPKVHTTNRASFHFNSKCSCFKRAVLVFVLVLCISFLPACIKIYKKHTFRLVDTTNYVMTELGPAYELVFYHPYKSNDETMMKHADSIEELWQSGYYEDSTEEFLLVTYYLSKSDVNYRDKMFFQACYFLDNIQ